VTVSAAGTASLRRCYTLFGNKGTHRENQAKHLAISDKTLIFAPIKNNKYV